MQTNQDPGRIYLTTLHHSDLTWQFPYAEYDGIRETQLELVMGFFEKYPGYGFLIDQAYVLQNYLERHPERRRDILAHFAEGNGSLEIAGGFSIPDLNLSSGESFVRNCLLGFEIYRATLGKVPETASLMDAFGMPMQMPQVLSKLGYRYLMPGRCANAHGGLDPDKPFLWRGPAGTKVLVVPNGAGVDKSSHLTNVPVLLDESQRFEKTMHDLQETEGNVLAYYMTEIQLLDEAFFSHLEAANRDPAAKRKISFGRFADYSRTLDESALPAYGGEFNPTLTGCYTTRIGVKQKIRQAENALFATELAGALARKTLDFGTLWAQLGLAQFHDAACGCHHDKANADVHAKLDFVLDGAEKALASLMEVGGTDALLVLNPSADTRPRLVETSADALPAGHPVQRDGDRLVFCTDLPSFGTARFAVDPAKEVPPSRSLDVAGYRGRTDSFSFDFSGVHPRISSNRYPQNVFGQTGFGEILFRHESGSMWSESLLEPPCGAECQEEAVVSVEEGPLFIQVTTHGRVKPGRKPLSGNLGDYWTGFESLSFRKEYRFPLHLPYFQLRLQVEFAGCNTKVSLRIPVELDPLRATALYDTPFAAVARKPYFEVPHIYESTAGPLANPSEYAHARGDYPALHWVDYRDDRIGLAVANHGTPGHQLVGKDLFVSLLRSGTRCLDGTMYPQPGSFDNGLHEYEFAFTDHPAQDIETAAWLGGLLNRRARCVRSDLPATASVSFDQENIVVSAIFHKDGDLVLRAYECFGKPTTASLRLGAGFTCREATMQAEPLAGIDAGAIGFSPYEIRTFLLHRED